MRRLDDTLARANDAMTEVSAQLSAEAYKPQDFSRRRHEKIALLLVRSSEDGWDRPAAFKASTDGDETKAVWFPKKCVTIHSRDSFGFMVVIMPGWVALDRKLVQGRIPGLSKARVWSPEQREAHGLMRQHLSTLRGAWERDRNRQLKRRPNYTAAFSPW